MVDTANKRTCLLHTERMNQWAPNKENAMSGYFIHLDTSFGYFLAMSLNFHLILILYYWFNHLKVLETLKMVQSCKSMASLRRKKFIWA